MSLGPSVMEFCRALEENELFMPEAAAMAFTCEVFDISYEHGAALLAEFASMGPSPKRIKTNARHVKSNLRR